jgi:copper chaperone CopZ
MADATFTAPGIHCDGCADSIKRSLGRLPGVQTVEVDVADKRVDVKFDESATDEQSLRQRLEMAGFPPA